MTLLDKSEWLKHVKAVIDTSIFIMEAVNDQCINVVVHCSDGWDRLIYFTIDIYIEIDMNHKNLNLEIF